MTIQLENSDIFYGFKYFNNVFDGLQVTNSSQTSYSLGLDATSSDISKMTLRSSLQQTTGSVQTTSTSSITSNSAIISGNVIDPGTTNTGFDAYIFRGFFVKTGTGDAFSYNSVWDSASEGTGTGSYSTNITGLQSNTQYTGRAYLAYYDGSSFYYTYGSNITFTTLS